MTILGAHRRCTASASAGGYCGLSAWLGAVHFALGVRSSHYSGASGQCSQACGSPRRAVRVLPSVDTDDETEQGCIEHAGMHAKGHAAEVPVCDGRPLLYESTSTKFLGGL